MVHKANQDSRLPHNRKIVDTLSHFDPRIKRITTWISVGIGLGMIPVMFLSGVLFGSAGPPIYLWIVTLLLLIVPVIILHELCHFIFQWLFSRRRPRIGFRFPYPYSILQPNAEITRNQAIISAIAPFGLITIVFGIIALFAVPVVASILLLSIALQTPICGGDLFHVYWLLKHPRNLRCCVLGETNILFERVANT